MFGAKLISVFPDNFAKGIQSHQGVVVLFDGESGAPAPHGGSRRSDRGGYGGRVTSPMIDEDTGEAALDPETGEKITAARVYRTFPFLDAIRDVHSLFDAVAHRHALIDVYPYLDALGVEHKVRYWHTIGVLHALLDSIRDFHPFFSIF